MYVTRLNLQCCIPSELPSRRACLFVQLHFADVIFSRFANDRRCYLAVGWIRRVMYMDAYVVVCSRGNSTKIFEQDRILYLQNHSMEFAQAKKFQNHTYSC